MQNDFETGKYIKELNNPNSIKRIDIKVINFRKYTINTFKSLLSNKVDRNVIQPKYKEKFNAINVNYKFEYANIKETLDRLETLKII